MNRGATRGPLAKPPHPRSPELPAYVARCLLDRGQVPRLPAVAPWAAWAFAVACGLLLAVAAVGLRARVQVTGRAPATLRGPAPGQAVVVPVDGRVVEVFVRSGDRVTAGQPILALDATARRADLIEAEARLAAVEGALRRLSDRQRATIARRRANLGERTALIERRLASQEETIARLTDQLASVAELRARGFLPAVDEERKTDELARARADRLRLVEERDRLALDQGGLDAEGLDGEYRQQRDAELARARRDAAALALEQSTVRAPAPGQVEGLVARPGAHLARGAAAARLVPEGQVSELLALLEGADRPFVRPGMTVELELGQVPRAEFGRLRASVVRIGETPASAADLEEVLGPGARLVGAVYRVELRLHDEARSRPIRALLRAGSRGTLRFPLRRPLLRDLLFGGGVRRDQFRTYPSAS